MSVKNKKTIIKAAAIASAGFLALCILAFLVFIYPNRVLPILMYHSVLAAEHRADNLSIETRVFKRQMEYLVRNNYTVIPLDMAVAKLIQGGRVPPRWVVITFDDAEENFYTQAYPIIKSMRLPVTLFSATDNLEGRSGYMNWGQLQEVTRCGFVDVGSHFLYHVPMVDLSYANAKEGLVLSKLMLEGKLGRSVAFFAYPFGAADDSLKLLVKECGYKAAVGTAYRLGEFKNNDVFVLKRVFMGKISMNPLIFKFMLSGYYVPVREFALRVLNIKAPRDANLK
jgi:peptidoglycan/xylan/chitin deacetylase (PgdA/CDA1 family)